MTQANTADLNDPVYAQLLAKIALLEQENQQHKQEKEQIKQQYETKLAEIYQQLQTAIDKQKLLIHKLFGQSSEKLSAKQNRLNQETALEDLASLEQLQDNFIDGLTNDEKTKLQATFNIRLETTKNGNSSQFADGETSTTADKPVKTKRSKNPVIPTNLDIKEIIHSPKTITCDCGCQMRYIGDDVQDKLGIIPKQFFRERHIYPKWVCGDCQTLVQAHVEPQIINKSIATPELLAHILISKYADHLPLYRQSLIYQRNGVNIPDSTLADWVGRCGVALEPLVKRLHQLMLQQDILHADETPVLIMKNQGMKHNGNTPKQGYVWAYITPQHMTSDNGFRAVIYDFAESRKNEHPNAFLQGWKGKLICDDYNGYKQLFNKQGVTEIGCMAHARRKFFDLHQQKTSNIAHEALEYIGQLYGIEREIDELFEKAEESERNLENSEHPAKPLKQSKLLRDFEQIRKFRQEEAKPIADKLYQWLQQRRQQVNKNSPIANALDYCLKRWTALTRYLDDGRLPIDNNWAENQMRPWALGRKNWLFAGSLRSGQRAANIMSLIQSARLNGLDPYAYLSDVLKRLPSYDANIDNLLPHLWSPSV